MKLSKIQKPSRYFVFRISDTQFFELDEVAQHLGLTTAEIARRSLRIALPVLRSSNLPGGPDHPEKRHAEEERDK